MRFRFSNILLSVLAGGVLLGVSLAHAADATQGVSDTEIVIGNITDLSGVTAVQGVNNSDAIRMVFDEVNAKGGINGRKIKFIAEDSQYQVPRAVQAMNKLLNNDHVFLTIGNGGTPMNDANMPVQFAKNVPNMFPLTAARSMYEPYNKLKFAQFASYYDQMRAAVKYFAEKRGRKNFCVMYQDSDFGKDVLAGVVAQTQAMGMKVVATTAHRPTDTDFNANVNKLKDAGCDVIMMGTIVRDTNIIIQTVRKLGWNVDLVGQFASYDTAVASLAGGATEGFFCMTPALYAYPDDPRPEVQAFAKKYKELYGRDPNFHGEVGNTAAKLVVLGLQRAGKDLTTENFIKGMESIHGYKDIFGSELSFGPDQHHGSTKSFLTVVKDGRWVPVEQEALGY
ncbi:ABC transporter substrate-binding protein [Rhodopila sp.]|jgi:branched-chain amino acid transport system substrate-binding protein|uniref:ABC transporter substrate-binding protein n=1 Tax=Rhodopila sp. TaxID=2480087 RepID=UPI002C1E186A|nr:ABC transporter substrate-binding protein [Rhodopila sp.]HVZ08287.1 ABC transporter substrate-binding protein [Rhodopila sp.]